MKNTLLNDLIFWRSISDVGTLDMNCTMTTMNMLNTLLAGLLIIQCFLQEQLWCKHLKSFHGPLLVNLVVPVEQAELTIGHERTTIQEYAVNRISRKSD